MIADNKPAGPPPQMMASVERSSPLDEDVAGSGLPTVMSAMRRACAFALVVRTAVGTREWDVEKESTERGHESSDRKERDTVGNLIMRIDR